MTSWKFETLHPVGVVLTAPEKPQEREHTMSENLFTIPFEAERETKNTIRYQEVPDAGQPPRIGTLYVQRWALPQPAPQRITVTISA